MAARGMTAACLPKPGAILAAMMGGVIVAMFGGMLVAGDEEYRLGPDSERHDGVPRGTVTRRT